MIVSIFGIDFFTSVVLFIAKLTGAEPALSAERPC